MIISWTNLDLIKFMYVSCVLSTCLFAMRLLSLQMSCCSFRGKELVIDLSSSSVSNEPDIHPMSPTVRDLGLP